MKIEANHMHVITGREDKLLGICDVNLDGQFAIRGVRVMDSEKGPFVSLPSYRDGEGKFHDVAFPVTKEGREALNKAVLTEYEHHRNKAVEAAVER